MVQSVGLLREELSEVASGSRCLGEISSLSLSEISSFSLSEISSVELRETVSRIDGDFTWHWSCLSSGACSSLSKIESWSVVLSSFWCVFHWSKECDLLSSAGLSTSFEFRGCLSQASPFVEQSLDARMDHFSGADSL